MAESVFDKEEERLLHLTQTTREKVITSLTEKGIPDDKDALNALLKALDGMDRTTLAKGKIKSDDKNNRSQQETVNLIGELLRRTSATAALPTERKPIELDTSFVVDNPVPGETDIAPGEISLTEIMRRDEDE